MCHWRYLKYILHGCTDSSSTCRFCTKSGKGSSCPSEFNTVLSKEFRKSWGKEQTGIVYVTEDCGLCDNKFVFISAVNVVFCIWSGSRPATWKSCQWATVRKLEHFVLLIWCDACFLWSVQEVSFRCAWKHARLYQSSGYFVKNHAGQSKCMTYSVMYGYITRSLSCQPWCAIDNTCSARQIWEHCVCNTPTQMHPTRTDHCTTECIWPPAFTSDLPPLLCRIQSMNLAISRTLSLMLWRCLTITIMKRYS